MGPDDRSRGRIPLRPATRTPAPGRARDPDPVPASGGGYLGARLSCSSGPDTGLELGALAEYTDGSVAAVRAGGGASGSLASWPFLAGGGAGGASLRLNLRHTATFRRFLLYVCGRQGAADLREFGATVTLTAPGSDGRGIGLDQAPRGATGCAVAVAAVDGTEVSLRRELRWFNPTPMLADQEQIDRAYGYGVEWVPDADVAGRHG